MKNFITFIGVLSVLPLMSWVPLATAQRALVPPVPPVPPVQRGAGNQAFVRPALRLSRQCGSACAPVIEALLVESLQHNTLSQTPAEFVPTRTSAVAKTSADLAGLAIRSINNALDARPLPGEALPTMGHVLAALYGGGRAGVVSAEGNSIYVKSLAAAGHRAVMDRWPEADREALKELIEDVTAQGGVARNKERLEEVRRHCNFIRI